VTNVTSQGFGDRLKLTYALIAIFLFVVLDILTDFLFEIPEGKLVFKTFLGTANLLCMGYLVYFIWNKFERDQSIKTGLDRAHEKVKVAPGHFSTKAINLTNQFDDYIAKEFSEWQLSPSEREIAYQLLEGKSSKQIANLRCSSERTIRNQCRFIYEKSGCSGRSELSAHFFNSYMRNETI
jgi:DNA-binding CsgD family transcriptional regulator